MTAAALWVVQSFEGIFRQAIVYRERTRDTAWFAETDQDGPALLAANQTWLRPDNFDASRKQLQRLLILTQSLLHPPATD